MYYYNYYYRIIHLIRRRLQLSRPRATTVETCAVYGERVLYLYGYRSTHRGWGGEGVCRLGQFCNDDVTCVPCVS